MNKNLVGYTILVMQDEADYQALYLVKVTQIARVREAYRSNNHQYVKAHTTKLGCLHMYDDLDTVNMCFEKPVGHRSALKTVEQKWLNVS